MQKDPNRLALTRRGALTLAGACLVSWENLYAGEFWDKKDPSQWTGEEIDQLTTKSPWAKSVTAQYAPGQNPGYGQGGGGGYPGGGYPNGGPMGGQPRIGIGGIGMPRGRMGGGRPGGGGSTASNYKGTVRWASAQPIRDAIKEPLPEAFAHHYVIAIRDIPLIQPDRQQSQSQGSYPDNRQYPDNSQYPDSNAQDKPTLSTPDNSNNTISQHTLNDMKQLTTLDPKGREGAQPDVVQQMTRGATYFLFGFAKEFLTFTKKDHEVVFTTHLGRLIVKAKFDCSEMTYHGALAV